MDAPVHIRRVLAADGRNRIHIPTATGTLVYMPEESVAEFAKREEVSPRRVRALIEQGAIPARQVVGSGSSTSPPRTAPQPPAR